MNWDDMSDKAINFNVSKALGLVSKDLSLKESNDYPHFASLIYPDYCNSWADMGAIIEKHRIMLNPYCANDDWKAEVPVGKNGIATTYAKCYDKNPLRAAAIVFLMMNGVKPEDLT